MSTIKIIKLASQLESKLTGDVFHVIFSFSEAKHLLINIRLTSRLFRDITEQRIIKEQQTNDRKKIITYHGNNVNGEGRCFEIDAVCSAEIPTLPYFGITTVLTLENRSIPVDLKTMFPVLKKIILVNSDIFDVDPESSGEQVTKLKYPSIVQTDQLNCLCPDFVYEQVILLNLVEESEHQYQDMDDEYQLALDGAAEAIGVLRDDENPRRVLKFNAKSLVIREKLRKVRWSCENLRIENCELVEGFAEFFTTPEIRFKRITFSLEPLLHIDLPGVRLEFVECSLPKISTNNLVVRNCDHLKNIRMAQNLTLLENKDQALLAGNGLNVIDNLANLVPPIVVHGMVEHLTLGYFSHDSFVQFATHMLDLYNLSDEEMKQKFLLPVQDNDNSNEEDRILEALEEPRVYNKAQWKSMQLIGFGGDYFPQDAYDSFCKLFPDFSIPKKLYTLRGVISKKKYQ